MSVPELDPHSLRIVWKRLGKYEYELDNMEKL